MKIYLIFFIFTLLFIINQESYVFGLEASLLGAITETYDDNITASSENQENDYITNLMLGVGIKHVGPTQQLEFLGHIYQEIFYKHKDLSNNSQDLILNYSQELSSRSHFALTNTFHHYPEPRDFEYIFGRPEGRYGYYSNTINLSLGTQFIRSFYFNIHYTNMFTKYINNALRDSYSNSAGSNIEYNINASNIFSIYYNFTHTRYESDEEPSTNDEIIQHEFGLGYQHFFSRQLHITIRGWMEYAIISDEKTYNPFCSLTIVNEIDENNTIEFSVIKQYRITPYNSDLYDSWNVSTSFRRQLTFFLAYSLSAYYEYGKTVLANTKSRLFSIANSLSYYFSEYIYLGTTYTYIRSSTSINGQNVSKYHRNQISIAISAEF